LLGIAREHLRNKGVTRHEAARAYQGTYAAEGSDRFWWFGKDQDSGSDDRFDDLFRLHLKTCELCGGPTLHGALAKLEAIPHDPGSDI
jgi:alpha-amylase/alpha-mannosidase (GH57 family)